MCPWRFLTLLAVRSKGSENSGTYSIRIIQVPTGWKEPQLYCRSLDSDLPLNRALRDPSTVKAWKSQTVTERVLVAGVLWRVGA